MPILFSVSFVNNQVCKANIKGTDADNDLAVIAVPLSEIPDDTMSSIAVATMGDSDSVEVGEQVVAIGNALGYGQSVTTGIISAANRVIDSDSSSNGSSDGTTADTSSTDTTGKTYLQTDAAINPWQQRRRSSEHERRGHRYQLRKTCFYRGRGHGLCNPGLPCFRYH